MAPLPSSRRWALVASVVPSLALAAVSCGGVYTTGNGTGGGPGGDTSTGGGTSIGGGTSTGSGTSIGGTAGVGGYGGMATGGYAGDPGGTAGYGAVGGYAGGPGGYAGYGAVGGYGGNAGFAGMPMGGSPGCFGAPCPAPYCPPGVPMYTPPGQCCPVCGPSLCTGVACGAPPLCPPGVPTHTPPGQCCPVCGPDCTGVGCAMPLCPPGFMVSTPPDQCCPTCMPIPSRDAGVAGCDSNGYASLVDQLTLKYNSIPCSMNSDCTIVTLNACGVVNCGTAINASMVDSLVSNANSFAANNCQYCPPTTGACPPVFYSAECLNGTCTRVP